MWVNNEESLASLLVFTDHPKDVMWGLTTTDHSFGEGQTWAVADTSVLDNEVTVQGFEDVDLPLEVSLLVWPAVLQLLHSHQGACVVSQRVIAA